MVSLAPYASYVRGSPHHHGSRNNMLKFYYYYNTRQHSLPPPRHGRGGLWRYLVNARELTGLIRPSVFRLINIIDGIPIPMSASSVPSLPEGSGTFSVANWNIRSGRGAGFAAVAKGLHQIGIGCMVLTETKLTNDRYPRFVQGYHVIALRATSPQQGGIALL